jgi:hypothetical protein
VKLPIYSSAILPACGTDMKKSGLNALSYEYGFNNHQIGAGIHPTPFHSLYEDK